jgi:hypothetical protein
MRSINGDPSAVSNNMSLLKRCSSRRLGGIWDGRYYTTGWNLASHFQIRNEELPGLDCRSRCLRIALQRRRCYDAGVMPKPKATKWFVGFFVNGIAADFRVHSPKKLRMARIGDVEP